MYLSPNKIYPSCNINSSVVVETWNSKELSKRLKTSQSTEVVNEIVVRGKALLVES